MTFRHHAACLSYETTSSGSRTQPNHKALLVASGAAPRHPSELRTPWGGQSLQRGTLALFDQGPDPCPRRLDHDSSLHPASYPHLPLSNPSLFKLQIKNFQGDRKSMGRVANSTVRKTDQRE